MTGRTAPPTPPGERPRPPVPRRPRWWPLARTELRRVRRDPVTLFFVVVLPIACFVGFGSLPMSGLASTGMDAGSLRRMLLMGVSGYGAATAATTIAAQAAVERLQGWGRQVAATPVGDTGYVLAKAFAATVVAALPVVLTFVVAALTGLRMPLGQWLASGVWLVLAAVMWAAYGLAAGLVGRTGSAMAIAAGGLVLMSFIGGAYVPLSGRAARWSALTPLHGYIAVARHLASAPADLRDPSAHGSAGGALLNVAVWGVVFVALALRQVRRSLGRR